MKSNERIEKLIEKDGHTSYSLLLSGCGTVRWIMPFIGRNADRREEARETAGYVT